MMISLNFDSKWKYFKSYIKEIDALIDMSVTLMAKKSIQLRNLLIA